MANYPPLKRVGLRFKLQHPLADRNRLVDISPPQNVTGSIQISVRLIPTGPTDDARALWPQTQTRVQTLGPKNNPINPYF